MALQDFVQRRNPPAKDQRVNRSTGGQAKNDDLKMPMPPKPSAAANTTRSRSAHHPVNGAHNAMGAPQEQRKDADGKPFYASSLDSQSTVSVQQRHAVNAERPEQQEEPHANGDEDDSAPESPLRPGEVYVDEEDDDDDDDEEELPEHPLARKTVPKIDGHLSAKQMQKMRAVNSGKGGKPAGSGLPYIKGDSYPTTTDGVPSESDFVEQAKPHAPPFSSSAPAATHGGLVVRGSGVRAAVGPQVQNQAQHRGPSPEKRAEPAIQRQNGHIQAPATHEHAAMDGVANGFSFAKAPQPGKAARAPGPPHQPQVQSMAPQPRTNQQQVPTRNGDQAAQAPIINLGPQEQERGRQPATRQPNEAALRQHHEHAREAKTKRPSRTTAPVQPIIKEQAQEFEQPNGSEPNSENDFPNGFQPEQPQPVEEEVKLDHNPPELYDMEYAELRAADFDKNPNAEAFSPPTNDLDSSLQALYDASRDGQAHFFSSLNISQWEEAGEWFLGRFGDVVSKLKQARQEKRKAARAFEDEVESRHEAVSKKRKHTEDALEEMKTSGAQVLQGTPKKARKAK